MRPEYKNARLRERPLTEKLGGGRLSEEMPLIDNLGVLKITKKHIFEGGGEGSLLEQPRSKKWNKQMYIFEKGVGGGSFGAVQVEKVESVGAAQAE